MIHLHGFSAVPGHYITHSEWECVKNTLCRFSQIVNTLPVGLLEPQLHQHLHTCPTLLSTDCKTIRPGYSVMLTTIKADWWDCGVGCTLHVPEWFVFIHQGDAAHRVSQHLYLSLHVRNFMENTLYRIWCDWLVWTFEAGESIQNLYRIRIMWPPKHYTICNCWTSHCKTMEKAWLQFIPKVLDGGQFFHTKLGRQFIYGKSVHILLGIECFVFCHFTSLMYKYIFFRGRCEMKSVLLLNSISVSL